MGAVGSMMMPGSVGCESDFGQRSVAKAIVHCAWQHSPAVLSSPSVPLFWLLPQIRCVPDVVCRIVGGVPFFQADDFRANRAACLYLKGRRLNLAQRYLLSDETFLRIAERVLWGECVLRTARMSLCMPRFRLMLQYSEQHESA